MTSRRSSRRRFPGSVWALTDAVGQRDGGKAAALIDRLAGSTPEPVLLAVLHRRIRELIEIADLVAAGASEEIAAQDARAPSFRAQQLTTQARRWSLGELQAALEDLLALDATVKGAPGSPSGEAQSRLGFTLWIADHAAKTDGTASEQRSAQQGNVAAGVVEAKAAARSGANALGGA